MKILIIQLRRIGDILLTTPVLPYLKTSVPQVSIDFLCEPMGKSVLETNPYINEIVVYDKNSPWSELKKIRQRRYDVIFDFFSNPRTRYLSFLSGVPQRVAFGTGLRSIFYNIRVPEPSEPEYVPKRKIRLIQHWLKLKFDQFSLSTPDSYRPSLFLTQNDETFAANWMRSQSLTKGSYVVMAPTSRRETREWGVKKYRELALKLFANDRIPTYLAWGPGEEQSIAKVRSGCEGVIGILPACTMREMGAIIRNSRLLVANDSGPVHLAVAVNTPTVTLYGPTRPVDWNPSFTDEQSRHVDVVLQADGVDCLGCHLNVCPIGHICMEKLSVEMVYNACRKIQMGENYNVR